jgi:hypothetical protein
MSWLCPVARSEATAKLFQRQFLGGQAALPGLVDNDRLYVWWNNNGDHQFPPP